MPRELRALLPVEIAAIVAIAAVPWPAMLPTAIPLLVVASLSRWVRGRGWSELADGASRVAAVSAAAGLGALVLALAVAGAGNEWSTFPTVRGNAGQLFAIVALVLLSAIASELALRGWVVERVLELAGERLAVTALAVGVGGLAEAMLAGGGAMARLGAFAVGCGLGWMYVAAGRSVVAPICARASFAGVAVVLEAMRVIG